MTEHFLWHGILENFTLQISHSDIFSHVKVSISNFLHYNLYWRKVEVISQPYCLLFLHVLSSFFSNRWRASRVFTRKTRGSMRKQKKIGLCKDLSISFSKEIDYKSLNHAQIYQRLRVFKVFTQNFLCYNPYCRKTKVITQFCYILLRHAASGVFCDRWRISWAFTLKTWGQVLYENKRK